jgi:hypothetical protein
MAKGTIPAGHRDFPVSNNVARQYDGTTEGVRNLVAKWLPTTDVGGGMFLFNARPGHELSETQLTHNKLIMEKLADQVQKGIEK